MGFMITSIALHLKGYGISQELIGLLFSIDAICYASGGVLFAKISNYVDKRLMMIIGLLGMMVTMILMGPSPLLPDDVRFVIASLPLLGTMNSLTFSNF